MFFCFNRFQRKFSFSGRNSCHGRTLTKNLGEMRDKKNVVDNQSTNFVPSIDRRKKRKKTFFLSAHSEKKLLPIFMFEIFEWGSGFFLGCESLKESCFFGC